MYTPDQLVHLEPTDRLRLAEATILLELHTKQVVSPIAFGQAILANVENENEVFAFCDAVVTRLHRRGIGPVS
jgi:hypothetical protein